MGTEKPEQFDGLLRTSQIIIGGLAGGVFLFLVIVVGFLGARPQPFDGGAIISMVMAALALSAIPARLLVPGLVVSSQCQQIAQGVWRPARRQPHAPVPDTDEGKLLSVFLTKTIIGAALLEGGAFANLIAFMLEGQTYSIALAILLLLGILAGFPTRRGLSEWLETQLRRLDEYRSMKPNR